MKKLGYKRGIVAGLIYAIGALLLIPPRRVATRPIFQVAFAVPLVSHFAVMDLALATNERRSSDKHLDRLEVASGYA